MNGRMRRLFTGFAAFAVALWADLLFSIGWTFRQCTPLRGVSWGAGEAVYGLPFPYYQWSLVSSMEYDWMPAIFAFNLLILTALAFWPVRALARRLRHPAWGWAVLAFGVAAIIVQALKISAIMVSATDSFRGGEAPVALADLRPAGVYWGTNGYDCMPSPFWFPEHKR
jgi:hypothetical protein